MAQGGDIIEMSYNHPTLGENTFYPKAEEAFTMKKGGLMSQDEDSGVAGNGEVIDKVTRKRWSVEGPVMWRMNTVDELSILQALSADPVPAQWTFTHVNGSVWSGEGKPVGDIDGDTLESTIPVKIAGGRQLQRISAG